MEKFKIEKSIAADRERAGFEELSEGDDLSEEAGLVDVVGEPTPEQIQENALEYIADALERGHTNFFWVDETMDDGWTGDGGPLFIEGEGGKYYVPDINDSPEDILAQIKKHKEYNQTRAQGEISVWGRWGDYSRSVFPDNYYGRVLLA